MPVPMSNLFGGQMPPGATVQPSAPAPSGMPMSGMPMGQPGPAGAPDQQEAMAQLIALLLQNPQFAQAVAQERARRQVGPGGPPGAAPMPGEAPGGAPSPSPAPGGSSFADALQSLRRR